MSAIGASLNLGFGLVLLWVLYFWGWRPYRIDRVRHDLFELRNELFLYAASGEISYENDAYRLLRRRIEALVRFAHTMSLTRVILIGIQHQRAPMPAIEAQQKAWGAALEPLPQSARNKLQDIQNRVYLRILLQMVTGNLLLLVISVICAPVFYVKSRLQSEPKQNQALRVAKELRVELIEEQAVLAQQLELAPA